MQLAEIKEVESNLLQHMHDFDHEEVLFCNDKRTGLSAIIAIHNTTLGPALGGCRFWNYNTEKEAVYDVLRLSRGMTYKASISGLNLGGGKAVIIGDPKKINSEQLMRRFGKFVNDLSGKYITAEDVGVDTKDMEFIRKETTYVTGLPESMGGGGNPSPVTGYGVYCGIKAAVAFKFGSDNLAGLTVGVQGVGHVGETVVRHLVSDGVNVIVNDINPDKLKKLNQELGVEVKANFNEFIQSEMDVYAPCALGATVNTETILQLNCVIIAGAANNQLANETEHGLQLLKKGIVYVPDFVINAGGLINVYSELHGYNRSESMAKTARIYDTVLEILNRATSENLPPYTIALNIAKERIESVSSKS